MEPEKLADKISLVFGTTRSTGDYAELKGLKVETVMVHPDYWGDQTSGGGNNYDLALIKMNKVPAWPSLSTSHVTSRISTTGTATTSPRREPISTLRERWRWEKS